MTTKKSARPLKQPAKPAGPTTFERTTAPMPRLQVAAKAEPVVDPAAETGDVTQLSDKDLILRLVEVLKSL